MSNRPTDVFGPASKWMAAFAAEDAERERASKDALIYKIMDCLLLFESDTNEPNPLDMQVANNIRRRYPKYPNARLSEMLQTLAAQSEDSGDMNDPLMTEFVDFLLPRTMNHDERFL